MWAHPTGELFSLALSQSEGKVAGVAVLPSHHSEDKRCPLELGVELNTRPLLVLCSKGRRAARGQSSGRDGGAGWAVKVQGGVGVPPDGERIQGYTDTDWETIKRFTHESF